MPIYFPGFSMSRPLRVRAAGAAVALVLAVIVPIPATAQLQQRDEQFYYPGDFNWKFLKNYPEGARLFNAFDYGHAVLYEKLYTTEGEATDRALEKAYRYLTTDLLIRPPRFAIVEEAVMPRYAKLAWRAKQMFDWAHILHRQIYDIYSDPDLTRIRQDSLIERATDYYLTRHEYAFLPVPKSMELMEDQYYSQAFREAYPKFNGLIWAYHWLQVGLYEPFIEGTSPEETKAGVQVTLGRFWSMLESPPDGFPKVMPMAAGVAPRFSSAHPRAAVIFDNLHMMHDIISDILQNDTVPAVGKREAIHAALDEFQDSTSNVMTMGMWRSMPEHMGGVVAMGGPALASPKPATAAERNMDHPHATPPANGPESPSDTTERPGMGASHMSHMMELHMRMMQDPVIRQRVMGDSGMRRMMRELMSEMPAERRQRMQNMMHATPVEQPTGTRDTVPPSRPALPRPAPADTSHGRHTPPDSASLR